MLLKKITGGFRGYTIKTKLVLAFIALISIPMLFSTIVVSSLITKTLTHQSHQKLGTAAKNIKDNFESRLKNLFLEQASYYAKSEEIAVSIGINASAQEFKNILFRIRKILNIDIVIITDKNGAILAEESKNSADIETAIIYAELINSALGGKETASIIQGRKGISYMATVPVISGGKNIGAFVLGKYIDREFLESLKSNTGIDSFISDSKGEIISSTFETVKGERPQDLILTNKGKDEINIYSGTINKQEWNLAPIELRDWKGGLLATFYVVDPLSALKEDVKKIRYTLILITFFFLTIVIFLGIVTARRMLSPIERVIGMLKDIAEGEADLTKRLDITSSDEIGQLAKWFNVFVETLQGIIKRVSETSGNVVDVMTKISNFSKAVSDGAQKQSVSTENTASSLNQMDASINKAAEHITELSSTAEEVSASLMQMAASIQDVSNHAEKAATSADEASSNIIQMGQSITSVSNEVVSLASMAEQTSASIGEISTSINEVEKGAKLSANLSEKTLQLAKNGEDAVSQTVEGMHKIKGAVDNSANVINRLGEKSKEIGKILNVINEIAEQTTLLALNAAIIAAQAGEHGRGFAVVADEIKSLAERTAISIKEIDPIIKFIQAETQGAVQAMDSGLRSMREGITLSTTAGDALHKIASSAEDTRNMVFQIAKSTLEQSKASEQIKTSMSNVTHSVETILRATQEQSIGGKRIAGAAEEIREVTSQVKKATLEQSKGSSQISKATEDIARRVQFVLKTINDQKNESGLILKAVNNIEDITTKNVDKVTSMDFEITKLTELVKQLQDQVSRFRV
ncbi:MAG: HAMP domain-containing protein [Nitrospirae bacterium]|nr:HAMP domain-containing protein [Nitrospirota bacterium]